MSSRSALSFAGKQAGRKTVIIVNEKPAGDGVNEKQ
jgi:hypothetical protein